MSRQTHPLKIIGKQATERTIGLELHSVLRRILKTSIEWRYGPGIDAMGKDWDNLILLDAYRYDYFKDHSRFEGDLSRELSRGSDSPEFIEENFAGRQLHDTVYVTANPHAEKLNEDVFYTIEFLYDKWDTEVGTILPADVTDAAIEAHKKYPNKRLIVHYMQPHDPFLGPTAESYRSRTDYPTETDSSEARFQWPKTRYPELYRNGELSLDEIQQAYTETIGIVEGCVERLLSKLHGKTVVSADHGENLGERRYCQTWLEHSNETEECRFVPWLELPHRERKEIIAEAPIGFESPDERRVKNQLSHLGYR